MKKRMMAAVMLAFGILMVSACSKAEAPAEATGGEGQGAAGVYQTITAEQAQRMMEASDKVMVVDVRTKSEYDQGHIEGAMLIPYDRMRKEAGSKLPHKDAVILVYCRSGNRSAVAAKELADMGYTAVYDFGGINDWRFGTVMGE